MNLSKEQVFTATKTKDSFYEKEYRLRGAGYEFVAILTGNGLWVYSEYNQPDQYLLYYDEDCRLGLDNIDVFFAQSKYSDSTLELVSGFRQLINSLQWR